MKIQKLVAFGIAGAALLIGGSSGASTQNLWSLQPAASKVATNNSIDVKVTGTGKCGLREKLIYPDGTIEDKAYGQSIEAASFPTTTVIVPKQAGLVKLVIYTVPHQYAVNCPAGQEISIDLNVFPEPKCPTGWQRTFFDKNTGVVACTVAQPQVTCPTKTQAFYTAALPTVCQAGCEQVVY